MKDLMTETPPEGLGEAQLEDLLEGEMAEDFIPKEKNGQILQVKEEGVMLLSTPLQPTAGIQGPLPIRGQTLHRLEQCWVIETSVGVLRTPHMEANTQTSIPTVEVLIPPVLGDNTTILHVSLSILGYEPDSLRTSGIRSPPVRAHGVSMIPQLDGPESLPIRDHTRWRMGRF